MEIGRAWTEMKLSQRRDLRAALSAAVQTCSGEWMAAANAKVSTASPMHTYTFK